MIPREGCAWFDLSHHPEFLFAHESAGRESKLMELAESRLLIAIVILGSGYD